MNTISGIVTDEFNNPLPGVHVYHEGNVGGKQSGTVTNDKGEYELNYQMTIGGSNRIVFSHIGKETHYLNPTFKVNNISLFPKDMELEEVVVTGEQKSSSNWFWWLLAIGGGAYALNKLKSKKGTGLNAPKKLYKKRSSTKKISI
jgi:hypothetical protein